MTPFLRKLLGLNWLLLVNMLALAIFGVVAIYSATYMREDSDCRGVLAQAGKLGGGRLRRLHGHEPD